MKKILILYLFLNLLSCTSFSIPGWEHRGDQKAQSLLAHRLFCKLILKDSIEKIQECVKSKNEKIITSNVEINLKGEMLIHNGYLFISKMEMSNKIDDSNLQQNIEECISNEMPGHIKNVANGIMHDPILKSRDFIYEYSATLLPEIKGSVKSVDYEEILNF